MKTFILLIKFTEQGVRSVKESPSRAEAFLGRLKSGGIEPKGLYWTFGSYDGVLVFDAPDEQSAYAAVLSLAQAGNVTTQTLRAYDSEGIGPLLAELA